MKKYIFLSTAVLLFTMSTGFVLLQAKQDSTPQQAESKKVIPLSVPKTSKSDDVIEQLNSVQLELAIERRKNDSVTSIRERNLSLTQKSVEDLRKANNQYRKSLSRLKFVLDKFPPDSVMKFYSEYKDDSSEATQDTLKKKINEPVIQQKKDRKSLWQKLFGSKH